MKTETSVASDHSGRWVLLLVAAMFFFPVIGSIVLFHSGWRPASQVNHGELVQPARLLSETTLATLDGRVMHLSQLQKKWTMLYFGPADCNAACQHRLYIMRQVHIAQGAEADRIQRVYVATGPGPLDVLQKDYPKMLILTGTADNIRQLAAQFQLPAGSPLDGLGRMYLVDPAGYFMMSYPADAPGDGMRRDMVRLLKISKAD